VQGLCPNDVTFGDPLLDDFRNYLNYALLELKGVEPSQNQYEIADWIWRGGVVEEEPADKRMAMALRGCGKSTIAHIFVPWVVRRAYEWTEGRPDCHVMIVSGTLDLAQNAAHFIRDWIEHDPFLRCLVPEDPDERWSGNTMNVRGRVPQAAPTIFCRGLMGRMTGDRANLVLFDDIEIPQNAETQTQRAKLRLRAEEFVDVLTPGGQMVGLGTPQVEDTVYVEMEEWGFKIRKWPARFPDATWLENHGRLLSPRLKRMLAEDPALEGTPTEPRFAEDVLAKREAVSRSRFQLQNMLDTSLADEDRFPLKLRDLVVLDCHGGKGPEVATWTNDPDRRRKDLKCVGLAGDGFYGPRDPGVKHVKFDFVEVGVDPSGRGKDETAYSVLGLVGGTATLLENRGILGGAGGGYGDLVLDQIIAAAARHKAHRMTVEDNMGDGMYAALLGARLRDWLAEHPEVDWKGCSIELQKQKTISKDERIVDYLEPVMNQHRLVVLPSVVEKDHAGQGEAGETYRLFHQMTRIQRAKGSLVRYDRLDSLAIAVKAVASRMGIRAGDAREQRVRREERDQWTIYYAHNPDAPRPAPHRKHRNAALRGTRRGGIGRRSRRGPKRTQWVGVAGE
jgi:hypothetical protein